MSVEIKSNRASTNNFGTYLSFITKPEDAFTSYKAKVLADGGEIQDEASTLNAIKFLIDNGLFGAAKTWISSKFGLKLDSNGNILKAYAIDGFDLTAKVFGTGSLPKLENGLIVFENSLSDSVNGSVLTSEKINLQGKGTCIGIRIPEELAKFEYQNMISSLTLHEDVNNSSALLYLAQSSNDNQLIFMRQIGTAANNSTADAKYVQCKLATALTIDTVFVYRSSENLNVFQGYRKGALVAYPSATPANFDGFSAYIDFGGSIRKANNGKLRNFGNFAASHFFLFDEVSDARTLKLASLSI